MFISFILAGLVGALIVFSVPAGSAWVWLAVPVDAVIFGILEWRRTNE